VREEREELSDPLTNVLGDLAPADRDHALTLLRACKTIELEPGVPCFPNAFPADALLLVDDGLSSCVRAWAVRCARR